MKKEGLYELLGDVDEKAINAVQTPPAKRVWRKGILVATAAAACIVVVLAAGFWHEHTVGRLPDVSDSSNALASEEDIAIEEKDIVIYYIKDNEMLSTTEYLPCIPSDIFDRWKYYNGIGDEVELISVYIDDNGTEYVDSSADSAVAGYIIGDTFTLTVTVTENLKNYYNTIPEELLLRSLKLTLTDYDYIDFDEYYLVFE